jgi:hypothetical protein
MFSLTEAESCLFLQVRQTFCWKPAVTLVNALMLKGESLVAVILVNGTLNFHRGLGIQ